MTTPRPYAHDGISPEGKAAVAAYFECLDAERNLDLARVRHAEAIALMPKGDEIEYYRLTEAGAQAHVNGHEETGDETAEEPAP